MKRSACLSDVSWRAAIFGEFDQLTIRYVRWQNRWPPRRPGYSVVYVVEDGTFEWIPNGWGSYLNRGRTYQGPQLSPEMGIAGAEYALEMVGG